jgi:chitinase domain-containing protein 1
LHCALSVQGDIGGMFVGEDFRQLVDEVDYFSLMTYDYSSPARPGPNSPIQWIRRYRYTVCICMEPGL